MKNKLFNALLLIVVTLLVLYFSLKDDYITIINTIFNIDKKFLIIGFFLLFSFINFWLGEDIVWAENLKQKGNVMSRQ